MLRNLYLTAILALALLTAGCASTSPQPTGDPVPIQLPPVEYVP